MAGPFCPPFSAAARLLRSSIDICWAGPWHARQFFSRIGATSLLKEIGLFGADHKKIANEIATANVRHCAGILNPSIAIIGVIISCAEVGPAIMPASQQSCWLPL